MNKQPTEYEQQYVELANRLMEIILEYGMPEQGLKPGEYDKPIAATLKALTEALGDLVDYSLTPELIQKHLAHDIKALKTERDQLAQRVAELEAVAATSREIIDTCMAQRDALQQRVAELEAENTNHKAWIAHQNKQMAEGGQTIIKLIQENKQLRAHLTAHPAAERWEYDWKRYDYDVRVNGGIANEKAEFRHDKQGGWEPIQFTPIKVNEYCTWIFVVFKRPARQEVEE